MANPAHIMAFRHFASDMVVKFNKVQAEIIRDHTPSPTLHNCMRLTTDFDHFAVGADPDIAT